VELSRHALSQRIRQTSYLRKWVLLGALIGLISGLGAVAFYTLLELATRFFLGILAAYQPPTPVGEGGDPIVGYTRALAIPFVVGLGGLLSGIIVFRFAPEAEGHGTDAAIEAFHHQPRGIRSRIPLIKMVASALTIGSGGSGGREGPTAQIGAGFGSFLGRWLDLEARDARIAVAAGMASGIGAIFRAPLGGAILGAEIPYRDDVEADALVPSFVASVVAFSVFGSFVGFSPIFGRQVAEFTDPLQLIYYVLIGLVAGAVGRLYVSTFYGFTRWFRAMSLPREVRPAIGGLAVGVLALAIPGVLGTGYGWVQVCLDRSALLALPLWVVLVLPFARILATALSIGSGGSGGVFGPGMVIGGVLGAAIWRLLEPIAPAVPQEPAAFVIVAMMALFGSVAHAPIAVMLMVAEMTGNLAMLPPAMIAVGVATLVVGEASIYASQLSTRTDSPAHKFQFSLPLMATIPAADVARSPRLVLHAGETAREALERLREADIPGAPVVASDGSLVGTVTVASLQGADQDASLGSQAADAVPPIIADDTLDEVLGALADHGVAWGPVVREGKLIGVLSARDGMRAYRRALASTVRQVRGLGPGGSLVRAHLSGSAGLAGMTVAKVPWPRDVVLVAVRRGDQLIVPRGDLGLQDGDDLTLFVATTARSALGSLLHSPLEEPAEA
jgi:CIC family chloride channel protein